MLLLFVGLILIAAFGEAGGFFFVLYGLGGIILISWLWLNVNLRGLVIQRKFDDHAYFGQRVVVRLDLKNRGFWPILWLRIHERLPVELSSPNFFDAILSLAPREKNRLEYMLTCGKRGYYNIGPLELQTGGFWGLFEGRRYRFEDHRLIVYPPIAPLTQLGFPSQAPFGELQSSQRLVEDPSRAFGVRPYVVGDSLRKVDWKTSAATNSLQVKRFQSSIALDVHIFLNLNQEDYYGRGVFTATELGVTTAASLAAHLSQRRQQVGLSVLGFDPLVQKEGFFNIQSGKGNAHLMQMLELLARVQRVRAKETFVNALPRMSAGLPWGTLALIVSASVGESIFNVLFGFSRRGLKPILVITQAGVEYKTIEGKANGFGIPCYRIEHWRDLDVWRE